MGIKKGLAGLLLLGTALGMDGCAHMYEKPQMCTNIQYELHEDMWRYSCDGTHKKFNPIGIKILEINF